MPDTLDVYLSGALLDKGDIITAHRPDGTCVGRLVWQRQAAAFTIWGDNEMTEAVDGFVDGEAIHLRVHDVSEGTTHTAIEAVLVRPEPLYQASAVYHANSFYLVDALQIGEEAEPDSSDPLSVNTPVDVPETFKLEGNYPNPFNPETTIRYGLPEQAPVRLVVYDVVGRQVAVLVDAVEEAGYHEVRFEASQLPSGMYVYRLQAGSSTATGTMVLMK